VACVCRGGAVWSSQENWWALWPAFAANGKRNRGAAEKRLTEMEVPAPHPCLILALREGGLGACG
jgi:hypothetical protein